MQKRLLITGANGWIGQRLLQCLKDEPGEIFAVSRQAHPSSSDHVQWIQHDLLKQSARDFLQKVKPTHLIHLAWETTHGKFWSAESNRQWKEASKELFSEFISCGGQHFVFAGSCAEYTWDNSICTEDFTAEMPTTLYGQCKKSFTDFMRGSLVPAGFSWTNARIFMIFGPGESENRFIPAIIKSILAGQKVDCTDCRQIRDYIYIDDLASALRALYHAEYTGVVNIGSGYQVELRTWVENIAQVLQRRDLVEFGRRARPVGDPDNLVPSLSRLNDIIGWRPGFSPEVALDMTIQSLKESV